MASPAKLHILAALARPRTIYDLAAELGTPYPTVHKAVHVLRRAGLVTLTPTEGAVQAHAASTALADRAAAVLRDVPRADWHTILRGDRPMMLDVLNRVRTARLTAEVTGKSVSTVHHMIARLINRGVLLAGGGRYAITGLDSSPGGVEVEPGVRLHAGQYILNPRLASLVGFLHETMRLQAIDKARSASPDATLVWHLGPEILFKSKGRPEAARPGALSAFGEYGIEIYPPVAYWFVSRRDLRETDFILQTLLLKPGDAIHLSYAALLLEKALASGGPRVKDDLMEKTTIYADPRDRRGMRDIAKQLVHYVETHDADNRFLPWEEHQRYRHQYGLATRDGTMT